MLSRHLPRTARAGILRPVAGLTLAAALLLWAQGWAPVPASALELPQAGTLPWLAGPTLLAAALGLLALVAVGGAGLLARARQREDRLRQRIAALEGRVAGFADLAPAFERSAVLVRTPEGTIRHWSDGCDRLFGFTAAEATGRTVQEVLGTRFEDGSRRAAQEELLRAGEWQGELRHRSRDGQPVVVAAHWILRRDPVTGHPLAVVELHADATALKAAEAALRAGEARLRLAQDVAGVGTWEWDPEADSFVWSPEQHALFGTDLAGPAPDGLAGFLGLIHPEDREAVRRAAQSSLESGDYEVEFRILRPGGRGGPEETRWLIGRGRRMPGLAGRLGPILGVHVDITARKEAEERQVLLMREVDHRAKNALAVVQAVLRLTRADSTEGFARAVEGRVAALARAQTLLTESRWAGAELLPMLRGELAPFIGAGSSTRVRFDGPPVTVTAITAQPLSMALHELATNAAKHGSLSVPGGSLALSWRFDTAAQRLHLRWAESGGPALPGQRPQRRGFGSRVIENTIRDQLGGDVAFSWDPGGMVCDIGIPLSRAVRRDGR